MRICLKIMIDFNDSLKTIVLYRICADIYLVDTLIVYIQQSHIFFTQKDPGLSPDVSSIAVLSPAPFQTGGPINTLCSFGCSLDFRFVGSCSF